jgi:threonine aldolase
LYSYLRKLMIDFRSDTVTRPTHPMLEAMMRAAVGDDVFGEDPSVNHLELMCSTLFGMEAAIFCPSGTMTNQIAIKCHTQPGDEVICERLSHVYQYEGGGISFNSGASVRLIDGNRGRITADQVKESINPMMFINPFLHWFRLKIQQTVAVEVVMILMIYRPLKKFASSIN